VKPVEKNNFSTGDIFRIHAGCNPYLELFDSRDRQLGLTDTGLTSEDGSSAVNSFCIIPS